MDVDGSCRDELDDDDDDDADDTAGRPTSVDLFWPSPPPLPPSQLDKSHQLVSLGSLDVPFLSISLPLSTYAKLIKLATCCRRRWPIWTSLFHWSLSIIRRLRAVCLFRVPVCVFSGPSSVSNRRSMFSAALNKCALLGLCHSEGNGKSRKTITTTTNAPAN